MGLGPTSDWLLELHDRSNVWAVPLWEKIQVTQRINKPTTMKVSTLGGTAVDGEILERRSDFQLMRDGKPFFRGRLLNIDDKLDDKKHTVVMQCIDYAGMLQHRYLQPDDFNKTNILPNNERTAVWEPTEQYRVGSSVVDLLRPFPNQQYEARRVVPAQGRPREWEQTRAQKVGNVVAFMNKVFLATAEHQSIRTWSEASSYKRGDWVEHLGRLYTSVPPDEVTTGGTTRGTNKAQVPGVAGSARWWKLQHAGERWPMIPAKTVTAIRNSGGTATAGVQPGWREITPLAPSLDSTNWVQVANGRYRSRSYKIENVRGDTEPLPAAYLGKAQEDIAWDLIAMTQVKTGGNLRITRGTAANLGRERDRTFQYLSQTIFDLVDDVGRAGDGYEWWIDADRKWQSQSPVRWRDRREAVAFEYGSTAVSANRESGDYYTSVVYEGKKDETTPELIEVTPDARGRWETYETERDVVLQSTLRERGDALLDRAGQELPFYRMTLTPGVFRGADIQLGDVAPLRVHAPPRLDRVGMARVVEIDVTIDPDGFEQVRIGLDMVEDETDMNTVGTRFARVHRVDKWRELGDLLAQFDKKMNQV